MAAGLQRNTGRVLTAARALAAAMCGFVSVSARAQTAPPTFDPATAPPAETVPPPPAEAAPPPPAEAAPPAPAAAPSDAPPVSPPPAVTAPQPGGPPVSPPASPIASPQPTAGPGAATPVGLAAAAAPGERPRRAPAEDPQADRVVLLPTAYTHPEGTVYFTSYDIAVLQVGYAVTDDTQVTLTALPIPSESFTVLDLSLKSGLVHAGLFRLAAIGSASGGVGKDIGAVFVGRAGAVAQLCLEAPCGSSFTLSSNVALAGALLVMANGVGGIWRVNRTVSLLGELATLVPLGTQGGQFNGATAGGGVRLHYASFGFDLTLLRVLDRSGPVLPFLTATYRSTP
jgi:hypothetical protein